MTRRSRILLFAAIALNLATECFAATPYWKGNERLQRGDYKGAVKALTEAIENDPTHFGALLNRGLAYERLQEFDDALADYSRAIEIVPQFARAFHYRGHVHAALGQYERAVENYDGALKHADSMVIEAQGQTIALDKPAVYYDRGNALYNLKKFEEAVANYTSAIALTPGFAAAHNNRGVVHSELGDMKAACVDRSKACELRFELACKWIKANC